MNDLYVVTSTHCYLGNTAIVATFKTLYQAEHYAAKMNRAEDSLQEYVVVVYGYKGEPTERELRASTETLKALLDREI